MIRAREELNEKFYVSIRTYFSSNRRLYRTGVGRGQRETIRTTAQKQRRSFRLKSISGIFLLFY